MTEPESFALQVHRGKFKSCRQRARIGVASRRNPLPFIRAHRLLWAFALMGGLVFGTTAMAAPKQIAELALQRQPTQEKSLPDQKPLFGDYLASGDGTAAGALGGKIVWDLYEDSSDADHHPAYIRGILERDGQRYPFEIIGLYTPETADRRRWRISGAISFADSRVLGMKQAALVGIFEAATSSAKYTIWVHDLK